jgi:hypothetical protein
MKCDAENENRLLIAYIASRAMQTEAMPVRRQACCCGQPRLLVLSG